MALGPPESTTGHVKEVREERGGADAGLGPAAVRRSAKA
jgi:hypothetical protein